MAITARAQKMLWGRAAGRCAICRRVLVIDASGTDDESIVGDAAHIIAEKPDGPRGNSDIPLKNRNGYDNLILLCKVDHKRVDDQINTYSVEKLHTIKRDHETWVEGNLPDFDADKQTDDEIYASYVDHWAEIADIQNWRSWGLGLLGPQPVTSRDRLDGLEGLRKWILSRIWLKRYEPLEDAFTNFRFILGDLINTFLRHAVSWQDEKLLRTQKFYQISDWDPPRYRRLAAEYEFHVDLVHDLMIELTRATNYICDNVREFILPSYRLQEGLVLVDRGPNMDLKYHTLRLEYRHDERSGMPYPGLDAFKKLRETRDYHIGSGLSPVTE